MTATDTTNHIHRKHGWFKTRSGGLTRRSQPWRSSLCERLGGFFAALTLLSIVFFGSAGQARAYTDPGSGALIWQMLVAGFVGAMFYFRRFLSWFKERRSGSKPEELAAARDTQTELSGSEK